MQLGKIQTLTITRFSPNGAYLSDDLSALGADFDTNAKLAQSAQSRASNAKSAKRESTQNTTQKLPQTSAQDSAQKSAHSFSQNQSIAQSATQSITQALAQTSTQTPVQIPASEVLLPNKFCPSGAKVGDEVQAFIYTDSQDRFIATTQTPLATLGQVAFLRVVSVRQNGVFLDLGLDKDIFMPSKNPKSYALDSLVAVKICTDKSTDLSQKRA